MTRRLFLESLAATGGTALLLSGMKAFGMDIASQVTAPPPLPGGGAGKSVVILGAGVAGLTSAYELAKAGYDVTVLEARSFAGGRSQTAKKGFQITELGGETQTCQFDEGMYINHGPWRIPFHQRSTLHYVREFGVEVELFNNNNDASYMYFSKGSGPLAGKRVRKMEVAADARGHAAEILAKQVQSGALDQQFSAADKALFLEYLRSEGYLSAKDYTYAGTDGRGWILKPGAGLNAGTESTPYALGDVLHSNAWRVLASVADWDQQYTMFQPKGGMAQIPAGFVRHVGDKIRYGMIVEKMRQTPKGVVISVVGPDGRRSEVTGDWCICTIPLSVLKGLDNGLSPAMKTAMNGAAYAPVGKIGLQMKRRFWEEDHWIYGGHIYTDNADIGSVSLPSTNWLEKKGVILGYYNFMGNAAKVSALSPADRAKLAVDFGSQVMPEYGPSFENAFSVAWHRVPYNLGGWAMWSDEARARDYPVLLRPEGRIYLAGEHLSHIGGWQRAASNPPGCRSPNSTSARRRRDRSRGMHERMTKQFRTAFAGAALALAAGAVAQAPAGKVATLTRATLDFAPAPAMSGAEIFAANCAACPQPQGQGITAPSPRLPRTCSSSAIRSLVAQTLPSTGRGGMPSSATCWTMPPSPR